MFDMRPIVMLAVIGIGTIAIGGPVLLGWLGYHLWQALSFYLGGNP